MCRNRATIAIEQLPVADPQGFYSQSISPSMSVIRTRVTWGILKFLLQSWGWEHFLPESLFYHHGATASIKSIPLRTANNLSINDIIEILLLAMSRCNKNIALSSWYIDCREIIIKKDHLVVTSEIFWMLLSHMCTFNLQWVLFVTAGEVGCLST